MPKGGKRAGAGRPKGVLNPSTIEKNLLRERLRQRVADKWDAMIDAQIANSSGFKFLVVRDAKTGRFLRRIEDVEAFDAALSSDTEILDVWAKDPSIQAFTDLANRTIDKPTEHVETEVKGTLTIQAFEERLKSGRLRAGKR